MRYTESNCVGCDPCRGCGRNIEKAFFCCDKCDTIVAGDIEIGSDDDYEESWLNEAPDGSGHMWCDDCVKDYREEDLEERFGNDAMDSLEKLRLLTGNLSMDLFLRKDGQWNAIAFFKWSGHDITLCTKTYKDYKEMLEELEQEADKWIKKIKEEKKVSA